MTRRFAIRGGDDWLLFAARIDTAEDDRCYYAVTECWPVWLEVERRFGANASLRDARVLELVAGAATDDDFSIPRWSLCDRCGEPSRFVDAAGIHSHCGCACNSARCSRPDTVTELGHVGGRI